MTRWWKKQKNKKKPIPISEGILIFDEIKVGTLV